MSRVVRSARRVLRDGSAVRSVVVGLLLLATSAVAQRGLSERRVGVQWRDGAPHISVSARDLVDARVRRELQSGIQKRVVVTVQSYRTGSPRPIATRSFTCRVTYDLWQRAYVTRLGGETSNHQTVAEVIEHCLDVRRMRVGRSADYRSLGGRQLYFAVRAEFDPISRSRCRQLLRSSASGGDPIGPIVVNIVRRDICQADRAVEFRSQRFTVPSGTP